MRILKLTVPLILLGASAFIGCDDRPSVPASVVQQAQKEAQKAPKGPTTQELVSGPRKRLELLPLPLSIEAPMSWGQWNEKNPVGIKIDANLIQGYTPNGEVQLQMASRPSMKKEDLARIMEAGKKEMAAKPEQILKLDLRPLGDAELMERQSVGLPQDLTILDADGTPHTSKESSFNWTLSVLVPQGDAYQVYEVNFIGLTKSQYDKDTSFLQGIVNTLRYDGATTSTEPTSRPAAAQ